MATQKPALDVVLAPTLLDDLHEIWMWNAVHYSAGHADAYLQLLRRGIDALATTYLSGKSVSTRPDLHYILIRRRSRGHGHLVVFSFDQNEVRVLNLFHTAQDWQNRLAKP